MSSAVVAVKFAGIMANAKRPTNLRDDDGGRDREFG
jgi:hypothetical protein